MPPAATASVEGQSAIGATIARGPPGGIAASCHLDFRLTAILNVDADRRSARTRGRPP